jgi:hypothetical protein
MQTDTNKSRLKAFGHLLLDPSAVLAIAPILNDTNKTAINGFRIVTAGGALEITDLQSGDALRQHFYPPGYIVNNLDAKKTTLPPTQVRACQADACG